MKKVAKKGPTKDRIKKILNLFKVAKLDSKLMFLYQRIVLKLLYIRFTNTLGLTWI